MRPFQAFNVVAVLRQVIIELSLENDEVLGGAFYKYSGLTSSTNTYMESDSSVYAESNPSALVYKPMCLHGVTLKCLRGVKLPIFARSQTPLCVRGAKPQCIRGVKPLLAPIARQIMILALTVVVISIQSKHTQKITPQDRQPYSNKKQKNGVYIF